MNFKYKQMNSVLKTAWARALPLETSPFFNEKDSETLEQRTKRIRKIPGRGHRGAFAARGEMLAVTMCERAGFKVAITSASVDRIQKIDAQLSCANGFCSVDWKATKVPHKLFLPKFKGRSSGETWVTNSRSHPRVVVYVVSKTNQHARLYFIDRHALREFVESHTLSELTLRSNHNGTFDVGIDSSIDELGRIAGIGVIESADKSSPTIFPPPFAESIAPMSGSFEEEFRVFAEKQRHAIEVISEQIEHLKADVRKLHGKKRKREDDNEEPVKWSKEWLRTKIDFFIRGNPPKKGYTWDRSCVKLFVELQECGLELSSTYRHQHTAGGILEFLFGDERKDKTSGLQKKPQPFQIGTMLSHFSRVGDTVRSIARSKTYLGVGVDGQEIPLT